MKSAEIRQAFLEYFKSKGHEIVPSSSLIPANDPTLLFTNAGMVQFKDVFLGTDPRSYSRATTSQRCVRAGGKHNDLENVGYTARHHTFFEMLGNFSFGDYFKQDAIHFAWEFLTAPEWMNLPKEKLWVTVYASDDEAYEIWSKQVGVPVERIVRIGDNKGAAYASDNFWAMGDTGPCGPCTEIFYDHGPDVAGGPPGSPEEDGDRYIEIWNVVFMQYNRTADGVMHPLPRPSVDTGMGLERVSAVMQHVHSNYEIDLFQNLLAAVEQVTGTTDTKSHSLKVIADHIRSCSFLIVDGVVPSNEGRGYVLRRIMRRAIRHGHKLGAVEPFFHKLVAPLVAEMGSAYPELAKAQAHVEQLIFKEEQQFAKTLDQGMRLLEQAIEGLEGAVIPGETIFRLYDTYGFPVDLTADVARERGYDLDMDGFEQQMEAQRERARAASQFGVDYNQALKLEGETHFNGYTQLVDEGNVVTLLAVGETVDALEPGMSGVVVLDNTAFYAESGGQVGDAGYLAWSNGRFEVKDTTKEGKLFLHHGVLVEGRLAVGGKVVTHVNAARRQAVALNHSATHLMHSALRKVLGEHVQQKGSLVAPDRLRFDFSHFEAVKPEELRRIEDLVNAEVRANAEVQTRLMNIDEAKAAGAMALFGEKYDDEVRVVSMGEGEEQFSLELCGGTHVKRTGDIAVFRILSEGGVAAGVRRIEAVTGEEALSYVEEGEETLRRLGSMLKGSRDAVLDKVEALVERNRQLERELDQLKRRLAANAGNELLDSVREIKGAKVLVTQVEGVESKSLRDLLDQLKNKLGNGVVLLAVVEDDKVSLVAGVTKELTAKVKAGDLIRRVAEQVGGKGGGRPDMAQGGGTQIDALPAALIDAAQWIESQL
ncbi:alanine--tRNA ligase [Pokkaliibacter sp. MBI-7]|uniref:alanine--tRNA ligase n=1 Tax=Pokkaliibacter sp. MBI-7 TaxID=3040600 RepID=UPI0024470650|nr:alanine--tRNA ligase [Pokkaliibacter sp. MBI-7]MDH2434587.1 alanine--tRNA ligase [Pokkaliibacter sp. MBI-7]